MDGELKRTMRPGEIRPMADRERQSQVAAELMSLDSEIAQTEEMLNALENRLVPVMKPLQPAAEKEGADGPMVDIAKAIREKVRRVKVINFLLSNMLGNLEI